MPKLDGTHLPQRLAERLADLKAGEEVAIRDVKVLLSDEQIAAMDAAWKEQQVLRKIKRARTKEEEQAFRWKTKRDVYIEAYERALTEASEDFVEAYEKRLKSGEVRAARIYLDTYFAAIDEGKESYQANLAANNELKRAHLAKIEHTQMNARDKEVWAMEDAIRAEIRKNMTAEELEQLEILEEHEQAVAKRRAQTGGRAGKARG
jgi:hypothetical protein